MQNDRAVTFVLFALIGALSGTGPALAQASGELDTVVAADQQARPVAVRGDAPDFGGAVAAPLRAEDEFVVGVVAA